jgi:hypothetical protein
MILRVRRGTGSVERLREKVALAKSLGTGSVAECLVAFVDIPDHPILNPVIEVGKHGGRGDSE